MNLRILSTLCFLFLLCVQTSFASQALDIRVGQGVGPVNFGSSRDDVEAAMGKPDSMQGQIAVYGTQGVSIAYSKEGKVNAFMLAPVFQGQLPDGKLLTKLTKDQVSAEIGAPDSTKEGGGSETATYKKSGLSITFVGGNVFMIVMTKPKG